MPDAGRSDYNSFAHFTHLEPGEPYFLVRGRDPASADTGRYWASRALDLGAPVAVVEQALQQADAMAAYPEKRVPQASRLSEAEAAQLEYQFSRRAHAAPETSDINVKLAERRAYDAAFGKVRPLLVQLFAAGRSTEDGSFTYTPPRDAEGRPLPLTRSAIDALEEIAYARSSDALRMSDHPIDASLLAAWLEPLAKEFPEAFARVKLHAARDIAERLRLNGERNPIDEATLRLLISIAPEDSPQAPPTQAATAAE